MKTKIGLPLCALAALLFLGLPRASSSAYVAVSVGIAPPAIPVYEQPFCPAPGYIWTPGYWAYGDGYYWVPGAWVLAPRVGLLWTPGYWGYRNGGYYFNDGYWGPTVGFYGGLNYGFGYYGSGYYGGRWVGNNFSYNTAVTRVNRNVITNTYVNREVVRNNKGARTSFNGPGGVQAKPTAREQAAAKSEHIAPTSAQKSRLAAARNDPALRAENNKGKPNADAVRTFENKNRPSQTAEGTKGNSQLGHRQGDEATRTKGSQNNAFGKTRSAEAQRSHQSSKPSHSAAQTRHNEPRKAERPASEAHHAPTASHQPKPVSHRPQATPHQQAVKPRQAAPGRGGPGPAQQEQGKRKKKKQGDNNR